jgi:hypothetical protein
LLDFHDKETSVCGEISGAGKLKLSLRCIPFISSEWKKRGKQSFQKIHSDRHLNPD